MIPVTYEHMFEAGLSDEDGVRSDVYLKEVVKATGAKEFELIVISGSMVMSLLGANPSTIANLGKWMTEIAKEFIKRPT